jgi:hypothetical protein
MEILPVIQLLLLMLSKCLFFENWIGTFIHWIMKMNNFKIKQTIISGKILRKDTMIGTKNCKKTILELLSRHLIVYLMFLNCFIKTMIQNLSKITFFSGNHLLRWDEGQRDRVSPGDLLLQLRRWRPHQADQQVLRPQGRIQGSVYRFLKQLDFLNLFLLFRKPFLVKKKGGGVTKAKSLVKSLEVLYTVLAVFRWLVPKHLKFMEQPSELLMNDRQIEFISWSP